MTKTETKELIIEIVKVYPRFEANLDNWAERLKDMPFDKGKKILNKWIDGERSDYSPTLAFFIKQSKEMTVDAYMDMSPRRYHINKRGELFDEEDREYGGNYEDGSPYRYYYSNLGYICRKDEYGNEVRIA